MLLQLALFAAAQVSSPSAEPYEQITPQVATERVRRCGVGSVTVRSDAETQTDMLVVSGGGAMSDEQLACVARAASFYDVMVSPAAQPRLDAFKHARDAAIASAEVRKWLVAHRLLGRLPEYRAGVTDDDAYTRQIEALCGAKGALHSRYGLHAINPAWGRRQMQSAAPDDAPLACLINVTFATGYELGFIGNEQYSGDSPTH